MTYDEVMENSGFVGRGLNARFLNGEIMGNAIQIGRYFKAHAEAAYNIMGLMDSPEVRDAKYLIKRIESTGLTEIKLRDQVIGAPCKIVAFSGIFRDIGNYVTR